MKFSAVHCSFVQIQADSTAKGLPIGPYAVPFDLLTHRGLVRPDIERIFMFRREALRAELGGSR